MRRWMNRHLTSTSVLIGIMAAVGVAVLLATNWGAHSRFAASAVDAPAQPAEQQTVQQSLATAPVPSIPNQPENRAQQPQQEVKKLAPNDGRPQGTGTGNNPPPPAKPATDGTTNRGFTPPPPVKPNTDGSSGNGDECPTDQRMQELHGFEKGNIKPIFTGGIDGAIPWEPCKWTLQHVAFKVIDIIMLVDWEYTVTDEHEVPLVFYGDGNRRNIMGATIRYRPAYNTPASRWVNDPCELLKRENAFGQRRTPSYETKSGNVSCGSFQPQVTQGGGNNNASSCFANGKTAADALGGKEDKWFQEDATNFPGTWKYKDKGQNVRLRHPGFGTLDYWDGSAKTTNQKGDLPVDVDEATFKC